jgi:PAS domain S-box-containing protein
MQSRKLYAAEFRIVKPDGTVRWLAARGKFYYAKNGDPERMLGVSLDVTERKLAEEKLQEYEKAVEGSEEMMAVVDREYRYLIANRKFLSQRNMTKEQVVGHLVQEVLNKGVFEAIVKEKLDECFRGKVVRYEMRYTYPALGERDLLISNFPIGGPGGVDRVACILHDITERKRVEEALSGMNRRVIEAEERERNRIAKDLHEDVGQRLALLAIGIDQLKNDLPKQNVELLDRVDAIWKETLDVLTDVKASAHELYSPRLEYLAIPTVMRSFCEEFGERKNVEIDFRSHGLPSLVQPEVSICLFRVLQEALHNGVKHSGVQKFSVQLWGASDAIHLKIRDLGAGFDTDAAGNDRGLGLTRMEQRVKLVEGTFSIDSQPEKGTTVYVSVPCVRQAV